MQQPILIPSQFGEIVRARRKARGLSQHALAAKLGVSQSRLSALESDPAAVALERVLALANLLDLEFVLREKRPTEPGAEPDW